MNVILHDPMFWFILGTAICLGTVACLLWSGLVETL